MAGLAFLVLEVGLFALVLLLLNARDRRRDRAVAAILWPAPPPCAPRSPFEHARHYCGAA